MKQSNKLFLDILMGAVIPILILNNLTKILGGPMTYVLAALVPVAWVLIDLFLITRTFNFITSYSGLTAIMQGALAFWFVDGVLFAVKDTAALMVSVLVFGGSILIGKPILTFFFRQVVTPDTPEREASLARITAIPAVRRAFNWGTLVVVAQSSISAAINFYLNLQMVQSSFGSEAFNQEVASVNAITRIAFPILAIIGFAAGIWIVYRAVYQQLPSEEGKSQIESEFWKLVEMREAQQQS
ncbi:MAG: hypothetical protein Fur005_07950 [Roseiflexaceae bacterium]